VKYKLLATLGFLSFVFWLATSGFWYKQYLLHEIQGATKIVVTEHSHEFDFLDQSMVHQIIYGEMILSKSEINQLYTLAHALPLEDKSGGPVAACSFNPHHTIKFYEGFKLNSTMDICFECGDVNWDGTVTAQPWLLLSMLRDFISKIGFHPDRDWITLAKQASS
jgi:hypothetical protein